MCNFGVSLDLGGALIAFGLIFTVINCGNHNRILSYVLGTVGNVVFSGFLALQVCC